MTKASPENVVDIADFDGKHRRRFIDQLISEHEEALMRFLRVRLANEADRDDVCQDVFLKLCRIDNLSDKLSLGQAPTRAYLFRMATNLINDRHRRDMARKREAHCAIDDIDIVDGAADVVNRLQHRERLSIVNKTVRGLKPGCREAFELSRVEGLSYREISDRMNVSVSMVEHHIAKALLAIRQAVRRRETAHVVRQSGF